jgi:hypothetical protein
MRDEPAFEDDPPPAPRRPAAPPPPDPADEPLRHGVARPVKGAQPRPKKKSDDPDLGPPLLEGTQEEDDDRPYAVPGDGTKKCPECNGRIPLDATFCTRCGTDLESRKKPKKTYQPIDREWEYRWPLKVRLTIFAALQGVNVLVFVLLVVLIEKKSVPVAVFNFALQSALQAFLLGSFETLSVRRNAKGQATITTTWRYFFVKVMPWKVPWKGSHAVSISGTNDAGMFAWAMCLYLVICACIVPGLVFWFMFIRPSRFDIVLCDVYGGTNHVLFRTVTWDEAAEIMAVIRDATGLADQSTLGKRHLDDPAPPPGHPDHRPPARPKRRKDDWDNA